MRSSVFRILLVVLSLASVFSVCGVLAMWKYPFGAEPKSTDISLSMNEFYYAPVYITNVEHISGTGTAGEVVFYDSLLHSSVTVPRGTSLTFRITVFNRTDIVYGFDAVVAKLGVSGDESGYDNENIAYTLTNLKRPYTLDGEMADDVTRIPGKQSHTYEITFEFAENTTDFSNATLNSILNFVFKPFDEIDPEHFTSPVDGALEAFKKILNTPQDYERLDQIMDQGGGLWGTGAYVGNVVGSSDTDSEVLAELFAGNLNLMLTNPTTGKLVKTNLTCMIKEEDLDGDGAPEMTIYMTPDVLTEAGRYSTIQNVYVGVFTQVTDDAGNKKWEQLGDLYHGTSVCNDYDSNIFNGFNPSINTDRWRSSQVYHGVKSNSTIENVIAGYKKTKS